MCQFQWKEGKDAPKDMVEKINESVHKDKGTITLNDVRQSIRKLKLSRYVENILYALHALTGTPLPYIKREIEDKMVRLLKQIERVFELTRSREQIAGN